MNSADFTAREHEILNLIIRDKCCKEIGNELGISTETVKRHRKNIAAKLGVKGKTAFWQAMRWLERNGI